MRALLNRCRRWLAYQLLHRRIFGEALGPRADRPLRPFSRIAPSTCIDHEAGLRLADHVYIGPFNLLEARGGITLEEGVQITSHCAIVTHSSHRAARLMGRAYADASFQTPLRRVDGEADGQADGQVLRPGWIDGAVHIGAYSFIGPHSVIEAGTQLGRGSLVCAGSVVRGTFPAFSVLRGNPAQWVGDTREGDESLLRQYPQAQALYDAWAHPPQPQRYVLVGDGESPHLVKWVQGLHQARPGMELWLVSSRGCHPHISACIPPERQLLLHTQPATGGGNAGILSHLPKVARWMRAVQPQVVHAHYLTSHGTLAWLACRWWRVPGTLVVSAWGSDVLITPWRSRWLKALTRAILRGADVRTADSQHLAHTMSLLESAPVQVFPFGLMALPPRTSVQAKSPWLFFSNRGLEPLYRIDRVLSLFAQIAPHQPQARLVIANQGSTLEALKAQVAQQPWAAQVQFVGWLDAAAQAAWYAKAQWYCSAPESDSVAVSVLEAMAHGCIPLLSDLPANRELVPDASAGWVLPDAHWTAAAAASPHSPSPSAGAVDPSSTTLGRLQVLRAQAPAIAERNRAWVADHAVFPDALDRFLRTLPLPSPPPSTP